MVNILYAVCSKPWPFETENCSPFSRRPLTCAKGNVFNRPPENLRLNWWFYIIINVFSFIPCTRCIEI